MPSTYTPSLRLEQPADGEQNDTWGDTIDRQLQLIDLAIAGITTVATTGGTVGLTAINGLDDQSRRAILQLTGSLASNLVIQFPPGASKLITIRNLLTDNGFSLTLEVYGSAGYAPVLAGNVGGQFYCDGVGIDVLSPVVVVNNLTTSQGLDPIGKGVPGVAITETGISSNAPPGSTAVALSASYNPGAGANGILAELYAGSAAYNCGSITTNGASTAFNTTSDHRAKMVKGRLEDALSRIRQVPVYRGVYLTQPLRDVDMVLAYEVAMAVPESVWGEKDAVDHFGMPVLQQWDASKMVPLLIAGINEAADRIERLEAGLQRLEKNSSRSWLGRLFGR